MSPIICKTFWVNIWIAGDPSQAHHAARLFAMENPICVTITPTSYVYVGGAEEGALIRLINYPRFPKSPAELTKQAMQLAEHLRKHLCQHSYSIETPKETLWVTTRQHE